MQHEYNRLLSNLAQARKDNNSRRIKRSIRKVHQWQVKHSMEVSKCQSRTDALSQ